MRKRALAIFLSFFLAPIWIAFAQQPPPSSQPPKPDFKSDPLFEELVKEVEKAGPILKDPGNPSGPGNPNAPGNPQDRAPKAPGNNAEANGEARPRPLGGEPPFSNQPFPPGQDPNFRSDGPPGQPPRMDRPPFPNNAQPRPSFSNHPQQPHNPGEALHHQPHPMDPAEMQWHAVENLLRNAREIKTQAELLRAAGRGDKAARLEDLAHQLRLAALDSAPHTDHQTPPNR